MNAYSFRTDKKYTFYDLLTFSDDGWKVRVRKDNEYIHGLATEFSQRFVADTLHTWNVDYVDYRFFAIRVSDMEHSLEFELWQDTTKNVTPIKVYGIKSLKSCTP